MISRRNGANLTSRVRALTPTIDAIPAKSATIIAIATLTAAYRVSEVRWTAAAQMPAMPLGSNGITPLKFAER